MSDAINKRLKYLVYEFIEDGQLKDKPRGQFLRADMDDGRINFLRSLVDLLMYTNYTSEETKVYLSDRFITLSDVHEELLKKGKERNPNTIRAKIWQDKNRLVIAFGESMLLDVVDYQESDITRYVNKLEQLLSRYSSINKLKNLALDFSCIPSSNRVGYIADDDFMDFIRIIAPYTKEHMQFITDNISEDIVNYTRYILSHNTLDDRDMDNKQLLLSILS